MKIDKISYFVNICYPPQRHEIIQTLILGDENDEKEQQQIENERNEQSNLEISNSKIQLPSIKSSSSNQNQQNQRKLGLKERMRKSEQFIKEEKARSTISNFIFENRQK